MDKVISKFFPCGEVILPSSKSYSHRYLIASFLSKKKTVITNVNLCDDVVTTLDCLKKLGLDYIVDSNSIKINSFTEPKKETIRLNANESGSTLRMLLPLAIELTKDIIIDFKDSLGRRPLDTYEDIFNEQRIKFFKTETCVETCGGFSSYDFKIKDLKSSQFVTGLLFLLAFKETGSIYIEGDIESYSYIDMTLNVLKKFGYLFDSDNRFIKFKSKVDIAQTEYNVEPDLSALPYFLFLGSRGDITIKNFKEDSYQGDFKFLKIFQKYGGSVSINDSSLRVSASTLNPFIANISDCIDLGPILFVLASIIDGESTIIGISRLKYKESDRVSSMLSELGKIGIEYHLENNSIKIKGNSLLKSNVIFDTHNDHRVAMSLSVLASITEGHSTILGYECVNKSFKEFYSCLANLRSSKIVCSIYSFDQLSNLKNTIDCALLNTNYSYVFNDSFSLDKAIDFCNTNNIEVIIGLNRIIMENELGQVSAFIDKYKSYKFLISDLGVLTLLKEKGLLTQTIYDPDTLICNQSDLGIYQSLSLNATSMSNEITIKDLIDSYDSTKADIFYQVFGRKMMFYSKRKLIKLYKQHKQIDFDNNQIMYLDEKKRGDTLLPTIENENGFFVYRGYNISLLKDIKRLSFLKYMFFESLTIDDLKLETIIRTYKDVLNSKLSIEDGLNIIQKLEPNIEDGFSYQDTVYIKEKVHQ